MGEARDAPVALPLLAAFGRDPAALAAAVDAWLQEHGPALSLFGPYPFSFTDYYDSEMGENLSKVIVVGNRPVPHDCLAGLKTAANKREQQLAVAGRRTLNLDPGLLDVSRLILATTKDAAHRIYLGAGIYAETTLRYCRGSFEALPWTYPDFAQPDLISWLTTLRSQIISLCRNK